MQDRNYPDISPIMVPIEEENIVSSIPDNNPSNLKKYAATATQITLATIGLGAGALYFGPAQTCADIDKCGKWIAELTNRGFAVGVLTAGGLDFSAGAAYMAAESGEATVNFIAKQPTLARKIGLGSFVIVFGTAQIVPLLLASLRTSSALWQTILAVGGATPSSIFGAVHVTEDLIPYYLSLMKKEASIATHHIAECFTSYSEVEKLEWAKLTRFRKQYANFIEQIEARYRYLSQHASSINTEGQHDPLTFLFSNQIIPQHPSVLEKSVHNTGIMAALLLTANFSAGGISNTFHLLSKYLPLLPLQIVTTGVLSISGLYANAKLSIDGVTAIFDTILDVFQGKPIHSLLYQLRPKTTALVTAASLAASGLSFAFIAVIYMNEFDPDPSQADKLQNAGLYGAMTGINVYHFASLFHLYHLLFSRLTPAVKEQFLLLVEKEIEHFKNMSEASFLKMVAEHPNKFAAYGFTNITEVIDIEAPAINVATEHTPLTKQSNKQNKTGISGWASRFFLRKQRDAENSPVREQLRYTTL